MKNLNIAIFSDSFLPGTGGTEKAVFNMCEGLRELGHNIKIYCPNYHSKNQTCNFDTLRIPSIKIDDGNMMALPSISRKLKKDIAEFKPDIIHFCSASGMAKSAIKMGKLFKIPVIGTLHTKFDIAFSNRIKSKLIVKSILHLIAKRLESCEIVSVVSNSQIPNIVSYGYKKDPSKIRVIKNGQNYKASDDASEEDVLKVKEKYNITSKNVFLFVGWIDKHKNIEFSIDALKQLYDRGFQDFQFVIAGSDGKYAEKLKKKITKYNLEKHVIFTGLIQNRKEINAIYKTAKLFLFPSIFDNDPLVLCEAALNGVPSITIDGTGSSERITSNFNGYISTNDVEDFTNKVLEAFSNQDLYKKVCKNLNTLIPQTWVEVSKEYEKMYIEAIENYKKSQR